MSYHIDNEIISNLPTDITRRNVDYKHRCLIKDILSLKYKYLLFSFSTWQLFFKSTEFIFIFTTANFVNKLFI